MRAPPVELCCQQTHNHTAWCPHSTHSVTTIELLFSALRSAPWAIQTPFVSLRTRPTSTQSKARGKKRKSAPLTTGSLEPPKNATLLSQKLSQHLNPIRHCWSVTPRGFFDPGSMRCWLERECEP